MENMRLMNANEVAEAAGITLWTFRRWRREGKAPKPLKGHTCKWSRVQVMAWLANSEQDCAKESNALE
jgi:predicted DNA-binding transcriptional regulator AlpA